MTRRRLGRVKLVPVLWLALVWVLLWGTWSLGNALNGVLAAVVVLVLLPLPDVALGGRVHLGSLLRFAGRFVADLVASSGEVAWQAVRPGPQAVSSVVGIELRSGSELLMTLTAEALTLVPGSVVIELDAPRRTVYAHVLDAPDDAAVAAFRMRVLELEARIIRAVGSPADLALLEPAADRP